MTRQVTLDHVDLGKNIVEHSRAARVGLFDEADWRQRLKAMIEAQLKMPVEIDGVRQVSAGAGSSNGTLLFDATIAGGRSGYVLRFAPVRPLFRQYDLAGQVSIQRGLQGLNVPVAPQCWSDIEGRYLGIPGYVMKRVDGEGAAIAWTAVGAIAEADPATRRTMLLDFLRALAQVHAVDWEAAGLSQLNERGRGARPIEREVDWYWENLRWLGDEAALNELADVRAWLVDNEPIVRGALCHGDCNLTNCLFRDGKVVAILDWEMAFIGAPECDLTYLVLSMTSLGAEFPAGVPAIAELYAQYERISGTRLENLLYFELFAYFRVAVIFQLAARHFPPEFRPTFDTYNASMLTKLQRSAELAGARAPVPAS
jgi:aminoglycoside phosphotransferase (APT) family kinase protein